MSEIYINAALVQGLAAASLGIPTGNEGKDTFRGRGLGVLLKKSTLA